MDPASGEESDNFEWSSEDELEVQDMPSLPYAALPEASSSSGPSNAMLVQHFVAMGFSKALVAKAIEENGDGNADSILETLLTYAAVENSPQQQLCATSDQSSSDYYADFLDDSSDTDSWSASEENTHSLSEKKRTILSLKKMGYTEEEASIALERCGPKASIVELTDFICAAQMARADDIYWHEVPNEAKPKLKKRKPQEYEVQRKKKERGLLDDSSEAVRLPKLMIGFGLPSILCPADESCPVISRTLPEQARGPPFFYYENVALAPKGVWDEISRALFEVEPEFVDSKYFCAAARKRGYIHNLPIENRYPLLPLPPRTISEALPLTKKWWPSWDNRKKLNCLQTAIGSARLTDRIRKKLEAYDGVPPVIVQKEIIEQCRKWNLVWVGRNKVAPLEPDEVELLLGFPKNHTRGGGISRTDRYKSLGNSFQVDTVAYHLSVLKELFPYGINLLSLFSGIGGAEVALYRLGIPLKTVVSVEKSEVNRNIIKSWWEQTNQQGILIEYDDVQALNGSQLEELMRRYGPFDLLVGGSPCNNLAGSNRVSRDGLEGEHSSLFYHYPRILNLIKCIMARLDYHR